MLAKILGPSLLQSMLLQRSMIRRVFLGEEVHCATQREIQGYLPSGFYFLGLVTQKLDMFNLFPLTSMTVI